MKRLVLVLLWLVLLPLTGRAADGVAVDPVLLDGTGQELWPAFRRIDDEPAALDAATAFAAFAGGPKEAWSNRAGSMGFRRGAVWLHVDLVAPAEPLATLAVIAQPRLDRVELYLKHADGRIDRAVVGDTLPFAERAANHRFLSAPLAFAAGERAELLLRVASTSSIQVPLLLQSEPALLRHAHDEQMGMGLYFGILLALLLYNLAVLVSSREPGYALYSGYVASFGLLMLAFNGVGFEYLWPQATGWQNAALPFSIGAVLCLSLAFTANFLDLAHNLPRAARWFDGVILVAAVLALLSLTPPLMYPLTLVLNVGVVVMSLMAISAAVACALNGFRPAYYFLLAWTLLIAGGVALPLSSFGLLPRTVLTEYGIQFGSAAEMILLSFSLAYRISLLRAEKEQVVLTAKVELEQRVQERTRELAEAAASLARANEQLAEASRRDGLTGLFNRRHLDQALDAAWAEWRDRGRPLALVMLDIDRFKSINDQHGHAVGDDCLREVASRCRELPLAYSLIARYGGEEFVLVLQDEGAASAAEFAEHLRCRVADHPVATFKGPLAVTISLGVAVVSAQHLDPGALLRQADDALYAAKKAGRNRVM